jgi:hypothetical protein
MRLGGQLRAHERSVIGWDMTAAMAMARALDCERAAVELLPVIEAVMVRKVNEQRG